MKKTAVEEFWGEERGKATNTNVSQEGAKDQQGGVSKGEANAGGPPPPPQMHPCSQGLKLGHSIQGLVAKVKDIVANG